MVQVQHCLQPAQSHFSESGELEHVLQTGRVWCSSPEHGPTRHHTRSSVETRVRLSRLKSRSAGSVRVV